MSNQIQIKTGDTVKFTAPMETYQTRPAKVVRIAFGCASLKFEGSNRISVGYPLKNLTVIK